MVNGDYWIYSDGNGQTILARCEGAAILFVDKVHVAVCLNRSRESLSL